MNYIKKKNNNKCNNFNIIKYINLITLYTDEEKVLRIVKF